MYRLEHGRKATFRVDIAGRRDPKAAGERGGQVAQDIRVQVGGNDGIERRAPPVAPYARDCDACGRYKSVICSQYG
jgi:hypothetical protein